jgi:serine protease
MALRPLPNRPLGLPNRSARDLARRLLRRFPIGIGRRRRHTFGLAGAAFALAVALPAAWPSHSAGVAPPLALSERAPAAAQTSEAPPAAPGTVVVGYAPRGGRAAREAIAAAARASGWKGDGAEAEESSRVLTLRPHASLAGALARLRRTRGVEWAVTDYIAHAAAAAEPFPNDPGAGGTPGGWKELQWNFVGPFGVNAEGAWNNLIADRRAGGRGVVVAVLDTGVAYSNRRRFRISPDFRPSQFVAGRDFIAHSRHANDRNGHGTFVAGTIAEATDNGKGVTGLAYGVRIMPVRVLNGEGNGDASTIAKGVRFAVNHGANVINLSLEFPGGITASDIPELMAALRYANRRDVVVVAAAGNSAQDAAAYPARAPTVIAVGATTEHGCLAAYSNFGAGVALVAPGGGPDASLEGDPNCRPAEPPGHDIFQETFLGLSPSRFGLPGGYEGTSMATPHVAAAAALVIASGVLGRRPTPAQVEARLRATARPLGVPSDSRLYGAGLLDAAAATAPGGPGTAG